MTKEQVNNASYSTMERVAMEMYDAYCEQVGGKAWDGRPLSTAKEFFTDETKISKQKADSQPLLKQLRYL